MEPDDGVQEGRYWQSDVKYYPNYKGNWCNVGNDYPEWMADPVHINTHLFDSATGCCSVWFSDEVAECEVNVIATNNGSPIGGGDDDEDPEKWYPTLVYPYICLNDGNIPDWMLQEGYEQYYVFKSKPACCKAFYCTNLNLDQSPTRYLRGIE